MTSLTSENSCPIYLIIENQGIAVGCVCRLILEHFINYFPTMKYLMSLFNFYYYFFALLLCHFSSSFNFHSHLSNVHRLEQVGGGKKLLSVAKQLRFSFPYPIWTFMIFFQWILFIFLNIYGIKALYSNWIRNHSPSQLSLPIQWKKVISYFENTKKYNKISV